MAGMDLSSFRIENAPCTVFYIPNFISAEEEQFLMSKVYGAPRTKWTVLSHRRLQNWGGLPGPKGMVGEDLPQWLATYAEKISDLGAFEGNVPNHVLVNEYEPGQGIMPHEDGPAFYPTVSTISLGSHTLLDFYYHINAAPNPDQPAQKEPIHERISCHTTNACSLDPSADVYQSEQQDCQPVLPFSESLKRREGGSEREDSASSFSKRHFLSLLLQPRSLVLLQDDMYKAYLHGIQDTTSDTITDKVVNFQASGEGVKIGDVLERQTRVSLTIRYVPKVIKSKLIFGKR